MLPIQTKQSKKALMIQFELEEQEIKILQLLLQRGAMNPSSIAAELWLLPGEAMSLLQSLADNGFVLMRGDSNSPDKMLVALTTKARSYLQPFNKSI